jgi:LacI family transcriptional regulator
MDSDHRAICYHAVGTLLSFGHRRLAFLMPKARVAGMLESEEGYRAALLTARATDLVAPIVYHDGSVEGIQRLLNGLFRSQTPPTGILVSHPRHLLTTMTHLSKIGLRIPEDVSIICADDDEILAHVLPSVARYVIDYSDYAKRLAHHVLLAATGYLKPRKMFIMAKFQKGYSLARVTTMQNNHNKGGSVNTNVVS